MNFLLVTFSSDLYLTDLNPKVMSALKAVYLAGVSSGTFTYFQI